MCGFVGVLNKNFQHLVTQQQIRQMTDKIVHRGPDDEGINLYGHVGLGFRRLSIIDVDGGHQPMVDFNNLACITFNGEIYNFKELKEKLLLKGYKFNNHSDTEVLLNMYLEYDRNFVKQLRGMFAFAIYDFSKKSVLLGRDHFGIKPLYYTRNNQGIFFGSEIKAILASGNSFSLNFDALDSYLSYNYTLGNQCFYNEIERLESGTTALISIENNEIQIDKQLYFDPYFNENSKLSLNELIEQTKFHISETINTHLISDVPVGAFLSGGIDSNAVVSQMIKLYPEKVNTFTIGFNDGGYDESNIAKEAALYYGTNHHELIVSPKSANILSRISDIYDEPFGDSSAIPTYLVSELAAQHVKVVLSGDGGDEFFGGYNDYQRMLKLYKRRHLIKLGRPIYQILSNLWPEGKRGKRFIESLLNNHEYLYAYQMSLNNIEKKVFLRKDVFYNISKHSDEYKKQILEKSNSRSFASKLFELDLKTFMKDDVLVKVDRASMANSVEVRVPFIDVEFFKFAASIPSKMKIIDNTGKYLLREAIKNDVPYSVYKKDKSGFTIPINKWFKSDYNEFLKSNLEYLHGTGLFNRNYLDKLLIKKLDSSLNTRLYPLLMLALWFKKNKQVHLK
jgi:asparagine synthase (glutamine-hydrolysing)